MERMQQKQKASQIIEKIKKHADLARENLEKRKAEIALREKKEEEKIKLAQEQKEKQIQQKISEWNEKLQHKSRSPSKILNSISKVFSERILNAKNTKNELEKRHDLLLDEKLNQIANKRIFLSININKKSGRKRKKSSKIFRAYDSNGKK